MIGLLFSQKCKLGDLPHSQKLDIIRRPLVRKADVLALDMLTSPSQSSVADRLPGAN